MDTTPIDLVIWLIIFLGGLGLAGFALIRGLHLDGSDLATDLDPHTTSY